MGQSLTLCSGDREDKNLEFRPISTSADYDPTFSNSPTQPKGQRRIMPKDSSAKKETVFDRLWKHKEKKENLSGDEFEENKLVSENDNILKADDLEDSDDQALFPHSISYTHLSKIFKFTTSEAKTFNESSSLIIDLHRSSNSEFITSLDTRMPELYEIKILGVSDAIKQDLKKFLREYFPQKIKKFELSAKEGSISDLSEYSQELCRATKRVEDEISISHFEISNSSLSTLFSSMKDISKISFISCLLSLPSLPFLSSGSVNLNTLCLENCSSKNTGDWSENPSHFETLVQFLTEGGHFKSSHDEERKIQIHNCGLTTEEIKQVLLKYGLSNVKIMTEVDFFGNYE
ncbi:unnamed protein product [Moneuplotes crassus]|uniref:Uncharacterized protein n=1 Tax=Euplotes crassus TaxID=5936 RepID=A0AAD1XD05_EUPCR|nr:unnamed protein product [Moneuplotes crassus]